MKNSKAITFAFAAAVSLVSMAHAGANVTVTSNAPARVFLDGRFMGKAPLQIAKIRAGQHFIKVQHLRSRQEQLFQVAAPRGRSIPQQIDVVWQRAVQPVVIQQVYQQPVVQQPVVVQRQVIVDRSAQQAQAKTNTRTALLGAAVANELLNKGNSKGLLRGVTLGGALLNEVAR